MSARPLQVCVPDAGAWDSFLAAHGGHLLQTSLWGRLKRAFGWQDTIVALAGPDGSIQAGALVLFRRLPLGLGTLAYVPRGPVVGWDNPAAAPALIAALDAEARRRRAVLLKIEPDVPDAPNVRDRLRALGFRESAQTVQPPRTIVLDISSPAGSLEAEDDAVLMQMSGTTRRKVRQAYRREVSVRVGDRAALESFSRLAQATGQRNAFGVHSPAYYEQVYTLFVPDHAVLLMASHAGDDLAGLFTFAMGRTAWYLYGASSDRERSLMPAYALQWEAIRWARSRGCTHYDLWGIPDADEQTLEAQFQQRSDGLWGVYGFKRGFGGEVVRMAGAWDRVYRPGLYLAYDLLMRRRAAFAG
jgi:lipid II:glycine glycyltransferase (peptidoglycan interpeptide bridge formation enzyme)